LKFLKRRPHIPYSHAYSLWSLLFPPPNVPSGLLGPRTPELRAPSTPLKAQGSRFLCHAYPCYGDCPLCLFGNSQATPSYRWSIRWAVGDLPPGSGSEGGGGGQSGCYLTWFCSSLVWMSFAASAQRLSWPSGPPPGHQKLRRAGLCDAHTHVTGTAPSACLAATRKPRHYRWSIRWVFNCPSTRLTSREETTVRRPLNTSHAAALPVSSVSPQTYK
jgi:hypothetical protein